VKEKILRVRILVRIGLESVGPQCRGLVTLAVTLSDRSVLKLEIAIETPQSESCHGAD
jgi:hypothetical protein